MKINAGKASEYGDFSIEPTAGKTILAVYVDFTTRLLIVEELAVANEGKQSQPIFTTTIDAENARVIPPEERKNYIDYAEQSEIDAETGLKRVFRREIDFETGGEIIKEKLYESGSNVEISSATRIAFGKNAPQTVFDSYKQHEQWKAQEELFWKNEYAAKDFAERAAYWSSSMFRHMRWQSESGLDQYAGFSPEWYEFAKSREPDFDKILDFIFERDKGEFDYQDCSPAEILRRIGKK
ncbi:MAG TPA: hypothetical protein VF599_20820 [Pyrinomonadaceae bacterium]|jgi:hypothetical protein